VIFELVHTYAARGLHGEPAGFATVAATAGLPSPALAAAESLSGYPLGRDDRPATALRSIDAGGRRYLLYSRTRPCRPTPQGLPNRIAHHLVIDLGTRDARFDLAALVSQWRFRDEWSGPPIEWPAPPAVPPETLPPMRCEAWAEAAGDAGWAGVVLERLDSIADRPVAVLLAGPIDAPRLAAELLRLLPPAKRASLTFSDRPESGGPAAAARLHLFDEATLERFGPAPPPGPALLDLRDRREAGDSTAARAAREGNAISGGMAAAEGPRLGGDERPVALPEASPAAIGPIEVRLDEAPRRPAAMLVVLAVVAAGAAAAAWLLLSGGDSSP
jgi:hypothetical protein